MPNSSITVNEGFDALNASLSMLIADCDLTDREERKVEAIMAKVEQVREAYRKERAGVRKALKYIEKELSH